MLPTSITISLHAQIQSGIGRLILREEMKARSNSYADPWTPPRSSASSREALHTAGYEGSLNGCKHNCPSFHPMKEGAGKGWCTQEIPFPLRLCVVPMLSWGWGCVWVLGEPQGGSGDGGRRISAWCSVLKHLTLALLPLQPPGCTTWLTVVSVPPLILGAWSCPAVETRA